MIRAWRRREGSKCFPAMISQWPKETAPYCHEPWPSSLIFLYSLCIFVFLFLWIFFCICVTQRGGSLLAWAPTLAPFPKAISPKLCLQNFLLWHTLRLTKRYDHWSASKSLWKCHATSISGCTEWTLDWKNIKLVSSCFSDPLCKGSLPIRFYNVANIRIQVKWSWWLGSHIL